MKYYNNPYDEELYTYRREEERKRELTLDHFQPEKSNFKDTWKNPEDKIKYEAMVKKLNKHIKDAKVRQQGERKGD